MIEASSLNEGDLVIHDRSLKPYKVNAIGKMKVGGFWVDAIIYEDALGEVYARYSRDFLEKFSHKKG